MNYHTVNQLLELPETRRLDRPPTRNAIIKAIVRETLPAIKPGRDWLVNRVDYQNWLAGYPHKPGRKGN